MKLRRLLIAGAGLVLLGGAAVPSVASAGTPNPVTVTAGAGPTSYTGTVAPGWPDPNGPPAPFCSVADGCDHEMVTYNHGAAPLSDTFTLSATVTYTPSDNPTFQNCLDIAILDGSASTVLAHQACAPSGATITDPAVDPTKQYIIEVDANGSDIAGLSSQGFTMSLAGTAAPAAAGPTPTPVPTNPFSFTHEVSVDVQHGDGEPDLAISNDNKDLFTATPYGFSTTISLLYKSPDGGVQWDNLHGSSATEACPFPQAALLRPDCSRGGGDTEIQLTQPGVTGGPQRVQFEDLNGLDSISCAYSDNGGDTFTDLPAFLISGNPVPGSACDEGGTVPSQCEPPSLPNPSCGALGTDRQWQAVWPKADQPSGATFDHLFMTFDTGDQPPSGDAAISSLDNGVHWQAACTTLTSSSCLGGSSGVGSRPGPLVINPTLLNTVSAQPGVAAGTYPTLYEFMGTNSNGTEVNISCDGGQTWSHIATSNGLAGSTTNDFVAGAIDNSGELYTAFTVANDPNPWRVWFAHSVPASGKTSTHPGDCSATIPGVQWSTPEALTGPPSSADAVTTTPIPFQNYAVMPWLTAGDSGKVDLVYYGTTQAVPYSPDSQASFWFMHMAQTLDGGTTWTDEQATETPMHSKSICFSGIGCSAQTPPGGDRNLLDFFQVKTDSHGRAIIIYTDDNNTAACAPTCSAGIGLVAEVQQASGPGLFSGGVPPLSNGLTQSLDVRQLGVDAEVTDPQGDAVVASPGHNIQGTEVPALDITDLKACATTATSCPVSNTHANTLAFLFTLKSLSGGLSSAVTGNHTGANWLVTWRWNNDLWFAQATTDVGGAGLTCAAGRPLSVFNDGEPKAAEYTTVGNSEATPITGSACKATGNHIEIDVPESAVGGVGTASDTTNHELYGLTGWTGESDAALPSSLCSADGMNPTTDTCSGQLGFFDSADETAPLDILLSSPATSTPEAPAVPLLIGAAAAAAVGGAFLRRRGNRRNAGRPPLD